MGIFRIIFTGEHIHFLTQTLGRERTKDLLATICDECEKANPGWKQTELVRVEDRDAYQARFVRED